MEDYKEKIYDETFETVYEDMKHRRVCDPRFTQSELKGILQGLYVSHGNDLDGRGEIKNIMNEATIAACELILCEWQEEQK